MVIEIDTLKEIKEGRQEQQKKTTIALIYWVNFTVGCDVWAGLKTPTISVLQKGKWEVLIDAQDLVTVTELWKQWQCCFQVEHLYSSCKSQDIHYCGDEFKKRKAKLHKNEEVLLKRS